MKASDILERRRDNWHQLQALTSRMESVGRGKMTAPELSRMGTLYRAACADLALADAYQLPPNTVQFLHRLVGRAHNQLYRARRFDFSRWGKILLEEVPQQIFRDGCVHAAFGLFWVPFLLAAALAFADRSFAVQMLGEADLMNMEAMFTPQIGSGSPLGNPHMAGFYIQHNTGIGLQCFACGLLVLPGIAITAFNGGVLGPAFGYMARPEVEQSGNFFHFVTAHGPFELTAIVLSAGAGLRLGMGWLVGAPLELNERSLTNDDEGDMVGAALKIFRNRGLTSVVLSRVAGLKVAARQAMPVMGASMLLFFFAAMIEGFVSPSALPYWPKATVAVASSLLIVFYFVVLGFPRR